MTARISHVGAICFAIAGFTAWVLCDSAIKLAGQSRLPYYEIVAFLGLFTAAFISAYTLLRGEAGDLWPRRPKRLLGRACLDLGNNLCVAIALRHLSLTLFYILVFTSPMVVVILGRLFLNERFDWRKAAAIMTAFAGVIIAVDPFRSGSQGDWIGYVACAVCVSCFSTAIVWSRIISQTERAESVTFFSGAVTACGGFTGMLAYTAPLNARIMAVLIVMGLLCVTGSVCVFIAVKYTTAATVSQYHYTQLVSGAIVAYLLFHEKPTRSMLIGAALIIASGLYIAMVAARANDGNRKVEAAAVSNVSS